MQFNHYSVMLKECIDGLNIKQSGIYVDCTLGGGGHSSEILKNIGFGRLICIDQDYYAITYCKEKFKSYDNVFFVKDNFKNIDNIIKQQFDCKVDGIIIDLGISSYQIDTDERGFSYMRAGKLDMRMDTSQGFSAYDVVNTYDEDKLSYIFKVYGEERYHRRVAANIVKARQDRFIETTLELVNIIDRSIPAFEKKKYGHLSKKVFQALRIEVNSELDIIKESLESCVENLKPGGRLVVISFHSLEDRIVKTTFNELALDCICPKDFPICKCDKKQLIKIINKKPILPSEIELLENSRSRSAKLRIVERI